MSAHTLRPGEQYYLRFDQYNDEHGKVKIAEYLQDWAKLKDKIRECIEGQPGITQVYTCNDETNFGMVEIYTQNDVDLLNDHFLNQDTAAYHLFRGKMPNIVLTQCNCPKMFGSAGHDSEKSGISEHGAISAGKQVPLPGQSYTPYSYTPLPQGPQQASVSAIPALTAQPPVPFYILDSRTNLPVNLQGGAKFGFYEGVRIMNLPRKVNIRTWVRDLWVQTQIPYHYTSVVVHPSGRSVKIGFALAIHAQEVIKLLDGYKWGGDEVPRLSVHPDDDSFVSYSEISPPIAYGGPQTQGGGPST